MVSPARDHVTRREASSPVSRIIRIVPGAIAAAGAFVTIKVLGVLGLGTLLTDAVVFGAVYLVLAISLERAMRGYGAPK